MSGLRTRTKAMGAHPNTPTKRTTPPLRLPAAEASAVARGARRIHLVPVDRPRAPYRVDETISVRAGNAAAICRVVITKVEHLPLESLTLSDARLMALNRARTTTVDVARWWMDQHDDEWAAMPLEQRDELDSTQVLERWRERWHQQIAWRLEFVVDPLETARFLLARGHELGGDERKAAATAAAHGYTENAARALQDAGECVPESAQIEISLERRNVDTLRFGGERRSRARAHLEAAISIDQAQRGTGRAITQSERRRERGLAHALRQHAIELDPDVCSHQRTRQMPDERSELCLDCRVMVTR